jgi:hypothetical protein
MPSMEVFLLKDLCRPCRGSCALLFGTLVWGLEAVSTYLETPRNYLKHAAQANPLTSQGFSDSIMLTVFRVVAHILLPICYLEKGDGESDVYRSMGGCHKAVH